MSSLFASPLAPNCRTFKRVSAAACAAPILGLSASHTPLSATARATCRRPDAGFTTSSDMLIGSSCRVHVKSICLSAPRRVRRVVQGDWRDSSCGAATLGCRRLSAGVWVGRLLACMGPPGSASLHSGQPSGGRSHCFSVQAGPVGHGAHSSSVFRGEPHGDIRQFHPARSARESAWRRTQRCLAKCHNDWQARLPMSTSGIVGEEIDKSGAGQRRSPTHRRRWG